MTIGDRLYFDGDFIHPIKNHPKAPFTDAIGNVLRQAYLHAQHASRTILTQSYGFDMTSRETDNATKRGFTRATDVGIARGFVTLPREVTHLRAAIMFSVLSPHETDVTHTLWISGTPDSNSATFRTDVIVNPDTASQNDQSRLRADFPFSDRWKTWRTEVVTAYTGGGLPTDREVRVSARAASTGFGTPQHYMPLYCSVWWEHHG